MSGPERARRLRQVALVLGLLAFSGSAALLISGYRPYHTWLTLIGSASTVFAVWSLGRAPGGPG
jgi:hypothetical protein